MFKQAATVLDQGYRFGLILANDLTANTKRMFAFAASSGINRELINRYE
jgi:hypothetical protein